MTSRRIWQEFDGNVDLERITTLSTSGLQFSVRVATIRRSLRGGTEIRAVAFLAVFLLISVRYIDTPPTNEQAYGLPRRYPQPPGFPASMPGKQVAPWEEEVKWQGQAGRCGLDDLRTESPDPQLHHSTRGPGYNPRILYSIQ